MTNSLSMSTSGAKYCPISPAQLSDSVSGNEYCPISSGSAASAAHGSLKRCRSGSEDDSGSSRSFKKKKPRIRYSFMGKGLDAASRTRAMMALRANYMGLFKATPIATLAKDSSDQLSKLKDLMLRLGKLEQAQSQLDRDRAVLIQEHAQLLASWS